MRLSEQSQKVLKNVIDMLARVDLGEIVAFVIAANVCPDGPMETYGLCAPSSGCSARYSLVQSIDLVRYSLTKNQESTLRFTTKDTPE